MPLTVISVRREADRRCRRRRLALGDELRRLLLDAGVSLRALGDHVGVGAPHLARMENGAAQPSLDLLERIAVAPGADLGVRLFPGSGPRLHDRFQAPMVEALLRILHPRWTPELEVAAGRGRGMIDLLLADRLTPQVVAIEAQSEIRRFEEQLRWAAEKADALANRFEPARPVSRLLLLRSTTRPGSSRGGIGPHSVLRIRRARSMCSRLSRHPAPRGREPASSGFVSTVASERSWPARRAVSWSDVDCHTTFSCGGCPRSPLRQASLRTKQRSRATRAAKALGAGSVACRATDPDRAESLRPESTPRSERHRARGASRGPAPRGRSHRAGGRP